MYLKLRYGIFNEKRKSGSLKSSFERAIKTGVPIRRYFPICLRYYYDENGVEQICEHLEPFSQETREGIIVINKPTYEMGEIHQSVSLQIVLQSFGVPVQTIFPVMDNELNRVDGLKTEENGQKVCNYISEVNRLITEKMGGQYFEVLSSNQFFGVPEGKEYFDYGIEQITKGFRYERNGLTRVTFEEIVRDDIDRKRDDLSICDLYKTYESSKRFFEYSVGDNFYHAFKMEELAKLDCLSGAIIEVPTQAKFDCAIFNLPEGLVVLTR